MQLALAVRRSFLAHLKYRDESEDKTRFDVLKRFLPGPDLELVELRPFAGALGTNSGQLRTEICRLRKRYAALLRGAIADTLALDAQIRISRKRSTMKCASCTAACATRRTQRSCCSTDVEKHVDWTRLLSSARMSAISSKVR
jgi:hypothetical protein